AIKFRYPYHPSILSIKGRKVNRKAKDSRKSGKRSEKQKGRRESQVRSNGPWAMGRTKKRERREEWESASCMLNRKHEALKNIILFLSFSPSFLIPRSLAA